MILNICQHVDIFTNISTFYEFDIMSELTDIKIQKNIKKKVTKCIVDNKYFNFHKKVIFFIYNFLKNNLHPFYKIET